MISAGISSDFNMKIYTNTPVSVTVNKIYPEYNLVVHDLIKAAESILDCTQRY